MRAQYLCALWSSLSASLVSGRQRQHPQASLSRSPQTEWPLSEDFLLHWTSGSSLEIRKRNITFWQTTSDLPFVSASAGNDSVLGSSGALSIERTDFDMCRDIRVDSVKDVDWNGPSAAQVQGELLGCGNVSAPFALTFWVPADLDDRVAFYLDIEQVETGHGPLKKLYLRFRSTADEDFYGLGAQGSFASLKNQSIPILSREQGVGRGDAPITSIENANGSFAGGDELTTYTAIPSYISTDGKVFYLSEKSTGYAEFNFTLADTVSIRYDSLSVDGAFTIEDDMFDAIEALTAYTGRQPHLPDWVDNGAILGIQGGQDKVNSIVEQGLGQNISCPIAAVWLQDWCGTHSQAGPYINISRVWWNWESDEVLYPTWDDFVQNLRDRHNVRTLTYINTFLANVSGKTTGYRRNLFDEATAAHYTVQNTTINSTAIISSGPGIEAGIVDLTNPGLREWLEDVLRTQVWNANISGFMTDFGEYTPVTADTKIYDTVSDAFFYHNSYPTQWAQYHRGLFESLGLENEALLFHRSASMGSNRHINLFWAGDQNLNWGVNDGIKSVVTIMAHMGFSGYAQQHSDVGGFTDVLTYARYNVTRSAELLGRWGELAAVSSAVFRSHEGNIPSVNAQFYSNGTTYRYFAHNARMFVSLARYRRHVLSTESETRGWPLLRAPVLYHTQDPRARRIRYESFYLGEHLYVAPVLDPQTLSVRVYFPGGSDRTYEHVWTGAVYRGGQEADVSAPYGKPAVFLVNAARGVPALGDFLEFVRSENGTALSIE